ncbi:MAG: hypothetical protein D6785_03350 [Planctomycetota bacterium]|nr:MAG: hypothetical protein D6785_03350 [Planctomycetota bacterium]
MDQFVSHPLQSSILKQKILAVLGGTRGIMKIMAHSDIEMKKKGIAFLGKLQPNPLRILILVAFLEDKNPNLQQMSAALLGRWKADLEIVKAALIKAAKENSHKGLQETARKALEKIGVTKDELLLAQPAENYWSDFFKKEIRKIQKGELENMKLIKEIGGFLWDKKILPWPMVFILLRYDLFPENKLRNMENQFAKLPWQTFFHLLKHEPSPPLNLSLHYIEENLKICLDLQSELEKIFEKKGWPQDKLFESLWGSEEEAENDENDEKKKDDEKRDSEEGETIIEGMKTAKEYDELAEELPQAERAIIEWSDKELPKEEKKEKIRKEKPQKRFRQRKQIQAKIRQIQRKEKQKKKKKD